MNPGAQNTYKNQVRSLIATYKVGFGKEDRNGVNTGKKPPLGRIPRVTRFLALAHQIDEMIRKDKLKDWADAARLVGVTRARMTQIAKLLLLAPEIQENILNLGPIEIGSDPITERMMRSIVIRSEWDLQIFAVKVEGFKEGF